MYTATLDVIANNVNTLSVLHELMKGTRATSSTVDWNHRDSQKYTKIVVEFEGTKYDILVVITRWYSNGHDVRNEWSCVEDVIRDVMRECVVQ